MHRTLALAACLSAPLAAQPAGGAETLDRTAFFERKIRPALAAHCQACHSSKSKAPMGGLVLDQPSGILRGGSRGPAVVRGNPGTSLLLQALRYAGGLQMPPAGKLPAAVISDFEEWIASGAAIPRDTTPEAAPAAKGPDFTRGRQWWAFQPLAEIAAPAVSTPAWPKTKIDHFVLAALTRNKLAPSREAARRTLIRRASLDLTGVPPSYAEIEAFAADPRPDAYEKLIGSLLLSPRYGERWGRHWLDVARWAEDNPTSEATNQPYPFAWRYRDWVIEAMNADIPYDRFVKMQLAADQLPGFRRDDLRALGYLGAAPVYHKDARLSKEVIETLSTDDWDERVDAVTRGILGLSVACARCHDHKFDPISARDYHGLAGVFASTMIVKRPLTPIDPATESRLVWNQDRITRLDYMSKMLTGEPGTSPEESRKRVIAMTAESDALKRETPAFEGPLAHAVIDAGVWVNGTDSELTTLDFRMGVPRDLPVFRGGNVANPGEIVPRRFLTVLEPGEPAPFRHGAGRLDLAEKIFTAAAPLAARVIVNRVWGWHFGRALAATPSDLGTQGERPTHPELLDDLAARFIANGWSLKWLHREIMLSAAYRQDSRPDAKAASIDPGNRWLWRMTPRRLEMESWRDRMIEAAGGLDPAMYGPSSDLEDKANLRRTVYARVSRGRLNAVFKLFDFPDASQHSPAREVTTSPLQQLFAMNSPFMLDQARRLAGRVESVEEPAARVRQLYRQALGRDPSAREQDLALSFATTPERWKQLAQALLASNEMMFLE